MPLVNNISMNIGPLAGFATTTVPVIAPVCRQFGGSPVGVWQSPLANAENSRNNWVLGLARFSHAYACQRSDGGAPSAPKAEWRPKVGDAVFHVRYGEVDVVSIKDDPNIGTIIGMSWMNNSVAERFDAKLMCQLNPGSEEYQTHLKRHLERHKYLPEVVGIAYLVFFSRYFENFINKECLEEHFKIKDLTFTVLVHAARALASRTMRGFHVYNIEKGNPNTEGHVLRRCLGVDTVDGLEVPNLDKARQLFQFIYDETGIDIIERGFRFIGHEPQILESMLSNKLEKTANRYYRNFNVSSVALRYYTAQKLEQIAAVPNLWSVGDYDDDHEAYLAMRDGDADAIQMFADRIASLVKGDAAFNDAELIVAVPGREAFGKPLDLLAVRIAEMTGKTFVDGIWQGRLQSRIASEAQISFRQKAEQAFDNYRLRSATGKVVRGLKGKTVIAIDDNYTTGATMDAVTLALINAGAVKVLRIVATRTNRY